MTYSEISKHAKIIAKFIVAQDFAASSEHWEKVSRVLTVAEARELKKLYEAFAKWPLFHKLDVVTQEPLLNERKAEKIAAPYGNPSDSSTWELV